MTDLLYNPVFNALCTGDSHLGSGTEKVKAFDEEVSPFAGFEVGYQNAFQDLHDLLPVGRHILIASPKVIHQHEGWILLEEVEGVQMRHSGKMAAAPTQPILQPLNIEHVPQMIELAQLTKPGPFSSRTIEFGHYYGVFKNETLVAMGGQRMHVHGFTEISAVCTHPDYLGKGYAAALVQHQMQLIYDANKVPFLHVRADNERAIDIYRRLGFKVSGPMHFHFIRNTKEG